MQWSLQNLKLARENGKNTNESFWVLESASDSDWSSNKEHRRSTSAGIHLINGVIHVWFFKDAENCKPLILRG